MRKYERAKNLRKNMTKAEKKLWWLLRNRQLSNFKFRRQHPVGPYYLDFACIEYTLAIEVDGSQHAESQSDVIRTTYLESNGWHVIRFWNNDVLGNIQGVYDTICRVLERRPQTLTHPAAPADLSLDKGEV
jgi:very-short-patch-repair endonuclease